MYSGVMYSGQKKQYWNPDSRGLCIPVVMFVNSGSEVPCLTSLVKFMVMLLCCLLQLVLKRYNCNMSSPRIIEIKTASLLFNIIQLMEEGLRDIR